VTGERGASAAGAGVPDLDEAIVADAGELPTVRRESNRVDVAPVGAQRSEPLLEQPRDPRPRGGIAQVDALHVTSRDR
jgi:hypothetical protein